MTRFYGKNRRPSTVVRDNMVHKVYGDVCRKLGKYAGLVPREYIYNEIRERTGLCTKTIALILNHTAAL